MQLAFRTNDRVGRTLKREASAPIPDAPRKRIAHPQIYPAGRTSSGDSHQTIREHPGMMSSGILGITPVGGGPVGVGVAQPPVLWEILTPGKPQIQDRILTVDRILTTVRILARVLVLARILTGTPMPPRILTRITLVRTLTRILILSRILTGILMLSRIPTRILTPSRIITGIPILFRTLIGIIMLDGNLGLEEILILCWTLVQEEIKTSARIQTYYHSSQIQFRLRKRPKGRMWRGYRKQERWIGHQGGRDHEVVWEFGLGFRNINHDFTVIVLVPTALSSGLWS